MHNAAKELQTRLYTVVVIVAAWLLSSISLQRDLELRLLAEELVAWVSLKEAFEELALYPQPNIGEPRIVEMNGEKKDNKYTRRLEINATWPRYEKRAIELQLVKADPKDESPWWVYDVIAAPSQVDYSKYRILFEIPNEHGPVEGASPQGNDEYNKAVRVLRKSPPEDLEDDVFFIRKDRRSLDRPYGWERSELLLNAEGNDGIPWKDVKASSQPLAKLLTKADGQQRSLLGMPFDTGLFFCAPGVILLIVALTMVGPLQGMGQALVRKPDDVESLSWTITSIHGGGGKYAWEVALCATSLVMALLPLSVLALQVKTLQVVHLTELERWVLGVGAAGIVVCVAVQLAAAWQLYRVRAAKRALAPS